MNLCIRFYERIFKARDKKETAKEVYIRACGWAAKHIVDKVEIGETNWSISKIKNADLPTFKLELFCMLDEKDTHEEFCDSCKQFHRSFFINQDYNCSTCKVKSYIERLNQKLLTKKGFRKERLDYVLNK